MLTQTTVHGAPHANAYPLLPGKNGAAPARGPAQERLAGPAELSMSFARNAEVFAEGEPSGSVYAVISGAVRVYKILADGRRQISGFHLPGDIFGLEPDGHHHFSADAIVPSKLSVYRAGSLFAGAPRNDTLARELWNVAMRSLARSQEHQLLLGRKNALERVAAFLLEMAGRNGSGKIVELPMPRHDIADYLGLTLETVSRMLAELKDRAAIKLLSARRVELVDPVTLRQLSS